MGLKGVTAPASLGQCQASRALPGLLLCEQRWASTVKPSQSRPQLHRDQLLNSTERVWPSTPHTELNLGGPQTAVGPLRCPPLALLTGLCFPSQASEIESQDVLVKATSLGLRMSTPKDSAKAPSSAQDQAPRVISVPTKGFPIPSPHSAHASDRLLTGSTEIQGDFEEVLYSSRYKVLSITA